MSRKQLTYNDEYILSYADYGPESGYPILIQHGLIASIDDADLFDRLLRHNARLICIARPGYGYSSPYEMSSYAEWAEIVSHVIHHLHLRRFDILGMSSGAPYGYSIGCRFPDRVGHIFTLSGIPALYDEIVLSQWPYQPIVDQSIASLQELARQLFFSDLTEGDLKRNDIRDSRMNHGFGVAQDLRLRFMDWGFRLSDVRKKVFMRHSKQDDSIPFNTAIRTAALLPDCQLELLEIGPHFSKEILDDFIRETMLPHMRDEASPAPV